MTTVDHLPLEERTARRAAIVAKYGMDFWISEQALADITAIVEQHWTILAVQFTGSRLSFQVNPLSTNRKRYDAETLLMKTYGNPPYTYGTEFTNYRLSFFAN